MLTTAMPEPVADVACVVCDDPDFCDCGAEERFLRVGGPFTAEQREWCLAEIAAVEGHCREHHVADDDSQLGRSVLHAWIDYCRDKGMMD